MLRYIQHIWRIGSFDLFTFGNESEVDNKYVIFVYTINHMESQKLPGFLLEPRWQTPTQTLPLLADTTNTTRHTVQLWRFAILYCMQPFYHTLLKNLY